MTEPDGPDGAYGNADDQDPGVDIDAYLEAEDHRRWESGYRPGESLRGNDDGPADQGIGVGRRPLLKFVCAKCGQFLGRLYEHHSGQWLTMSTTGGEVRGVHVDDCPTHGRMLAPRSALIRSLAATTESPRVRTFRCAPAPTRVQSNLMTGRKPARG
jgi:hypothetical protein